MNFFQTILAALVLTANLMAAELPAKPNFIFINIDDLGLEGPAPGSRQLVRVDNPQLLIGFDK